MRFIVYGAGAIGSTIGGHLHRNGLKVVLVANPNHADKIIEAGLKLVTPKETYLLDVPVCKEARELNIGNDDVILLTAKSQDTLRCLGQLKNAGASKALPICCFQNSIWNEPLTTRIFDRVYGAVIVVPAIFLEPGTVINPISGNAGFIEIGLYPRGSDDLAKHVSAALCKAGFSCNINNWIMKTKAAKCLSNLGNAVNAITDGRGNPMKLLAEARREAMIIWQAAGIEWEDQHIFRERVHKNQTTSKVPKEHESQRNLGSSWQSLMRRTGSIESEQLNGDIVNLGRMLDIPAPYNHVLWHIAEEMAAKKEKPGKYSAEELLEIADNSLKPKR